MRHLIKNASADIESDWISVPPGEYTLQGSGDLGSGTLSLQMGAPHPVDPAQTIAAADDPDMEAGPEIPNVVVKITSDNVRVRGVLVDSTGASGVNLWLL